MVSFHLHLHDATVSGIAHINSFLCVHSESPWRGKLAGTAADTSVAPEQLTIETNPRDAARAVFDRIQRVIGTKFQIVRQVQSERLILLFQNLQELPVIREHLN